MGEQRTARRRGLPTWLSHYQRSWLRHDVVASLTVWAVLIPESLAYATIAGVPPVVGLYAAVPALVLYALVGSSRHLVVGPMSATAALSGTIAATFAAGDSADFLRVSVTLSLVVGVLGLVAGVCRLGFLSSFISEPVLKGFIVGLALTIIIGQVPALLGVDKPDREFFGSVVGLLRETPEIHVPTAVVGVSTLAGILTLRRFLPIVPSALVAVAGGVLAASVLDLADHGVELVGRIEPGLPSVGLPGSGPAEYLELVGPGVGVLLIAFVEGLAAGKAFALRDGYDLDVNRELTALGASNLGSGALGGMVVNGSLSKTAVNGAAGARSQVSNLFVAGLTVLTLLLLTGLFENLPDAVLAAVVIAAVVELVDFAWMRRLYGVWSGPLGRIYRRAARADFIAAVGALLGVLVFRILPGLFIGIALSFVLLLYRASRPNVPRLVRSEGPEGDWVEADRHPHLAADPRVVVLRVEGPLFFANAEHVRDRVRSSVDEKTRAVVIDGHAIATIDVSGTAMLAQLEADLAPQGIQLLIATRVGQVRDVVATAGHDAMLARIHPSVDAAVEAALTGTDSAD